MPPVSQAFRIVPLDNPHFRRNRAAVKLFAISSRFIANCFAVIEIGFVFLIRARVEEENPCS